MQHFLSSLLPDFISMSSLLRFFDSGIVSYVDLASFVVVVVVEVVLDDATTLSETSPWTIVGVVLNLLAANLNVTSFRIPGYLQRIALCYVTVTLLYLTCHQIIQKVIIFLLMAIYLILLYVLNVPECGQGRITEQCNAVGYIDREIFGHHMILPTDPEGFFATLSAITTCYIGLEFGRVAQSYKSRHIYILLIWGFTTVGMLVTGVLLENWMPWNSRIYSFTYAMVATGFAGSLMFFFVYFG